MTKSEARRFAKNVHLSVGKSLLSTYDLLISEQISLFLKDLDHGVVGWFYPLHPVEPKIWVQIKLFVQKYSQLQHALVCTEPDNYLTFRQWKEKDLLNNIQISPKKSLLQPTSISPVITPDVIFVPALGFNNGKVRLGWGQGLYARFIPNHDKDIKIIGISYPWQCHLPFSGQAHDMICDIIFTGT